MEGNIFITGLIGVMGDEVGVELIDVISQVKKQPEATSFNVHINSEGGVVDTGFDIYNYIKSLNKPIKTIGSGLVASIATVIFMAGDTRVLRENTQFMIHLPMGGVDGTADEIEDYAKEVRTVEDRLVKFYSEKVDLDKEAIRPLLKNETWLNSVKSLELGFSNQADLPMVAKAYFNLNTNNMTKEDKSWIESGFEKIMNLLNKKDVANIMIQDANGATLDFAQIEEGQEITVGAIATVDGAPAEGEYVLPDGKVFVFASGELTQIVEAEAEGDSEDMQAQLDALKLENEQLKTAKLEVDTEVETQKELVVNLTKEVTEFKKQITSRFDFDSKKEKEEEGVELSPALKALNKLKKRK
jgi:ATP-dependent Clp endopeptidase proteolytic subunit ClpP